MSFESGKKMGLISTLMFVILPVIYVVVIAGLVISIISNAQNFGPNALPSNFLGLFGGLGISIGVLGVISLVALILFILAMYNLSHYYNERGIFTSVVYAIILNVITAIVALAVEFAFLLPTLRTITPGATTTPSTAFMGTYLIGVIALGVVSIVVTIVSALLIMRAFNRLGEKSEVDSFKTAGLLYLIGILLSLVVIGVVVMWIAFIFAAISFYRLKPLPPPTAAPVYQPPPPPIVQTTVCPNCGAVNNPEAVYCKNCGTHL